MHIVGDIIKPRSPVFASMRFIIGIMYLFKHLFTIRNSNKTLTLNFLDNKLTWKSLKRKASIRLNVIKLLADHEWGANKDVLVKTMVRSVVDYGSIIYSQSNKSTLKSLDIIENTAMRIITCALRTSLIVSLEIDTELMALETHGKPNMQIYN